MAKKSYVGVNNKSRNIPNLGYVGVPVGGVGKSRKILKGYVGVNNKSRLFWEIGDKEYNLRILPSMFFVPNTSYSLNVLDFRKTLEAALKTCLYLTEISYLETSYNIKKFINNFDNIWSYVLESLSLVQFSGNVMDVFIRMDNIDYGTNTCYIKLNFSSNDISNATLKPNITRASSSSASIVSTLRYQTNISVDDSYEILISYDISTNQFTFSRSSGRQNVIYVGYGFQPEYYANDYESLIYTTSNIGSKIEESEINKNSDFLMYIDCASYPVVLDANQLACYIVDDRNNFYGASYENNTNRVERTGLGLELKYNANYGQTGILGISSYFLYKGLSDLIIKFGTVSLQHFYQYNVRMLLNMNGFFTLGYYKNRRGWYFVYYTSSGSTVWVLINEDQDYFNNACLQLHFHNTGDNMFDLCINGVIISQIPGDIFYTPRGSAIPSIFVNSENTGDYTVVEKIAFSRRHAIIVI